MYPWISRTLDFWLQFCEKKCGLYMDVYGNSMARISYQNSTFHSFYKFDIRLLNWTFVLFISTFVLFALAFVFQGEHSFYINNIRFSKWTFA